MTPIRPPFIRESALAKVQAAEDAWHSRDPERVSLAYTEDAEWRNRSEFLRGRAEVRAFLSRKWQVELDHRLEKALWMFADHRIAVRFEYEWHDDTGQSCRPYGNEMWEFVADGLKARRFSSIDDAPIRTSERRRFSPEWPATAEVSL